MFLELNSKGLYQSSGKEKESCCLVFTFSTKRDIRHFHVIVSQRQLKNVKKSVMHVQSCCFAFLQFSLTSPSSLPKLPNNHQQVTGLNEHLSQRIERKPPRVVLVFETKFVHVARFTGPM